MNPRRLLQITVAVAVLASCGADSPDESDSADDGEASAAVAVRAADYAFLDVPTSVAAGTSFQLSNESDVEVHELVAVRLPDDEQRTVAELVALPPAEFEPLMAGLRTVVIAAPGADGMAVVGDGSLAEAGRYALLCVIPTGADPEEYLAKAATSDGPPDVAGGPPHIAKGMFAELTVTE